MPGFVRGVSNIIQGEQLFSAFCRRQYTRAAEIRVWSRWTKVFPSYLWPDFYLSSLVWQILPEKPNLNKGGRRERETTKRKKKKARERMGEEEKGCGKKRRKPGTKG